MIAISFPRIPLWQTVAICGALCCAALLADLAKPRLQQSQEAPSLESTVPRKFGQWVERPQAQKQVSLSTGTGPNIDQPYDQTVMRTYENDRGQVVMLALAWGATQRQEVKVHRPDLCYVAQGLQIRRLLPKSFADIAGASSAVTGKQMIAIRGNGGEAVSYWIRIGRLYSEDAIDTRLHIFKEGLAGRIPDGILVRASMPIRSEAEATEAWPVLDDFLRELVAATPDAARRLLVR